MCRTWVVFLGSAVLAGCPALDFGMDMEEDLCGADAGPCELPSNPPGAGRSGAGSGSSDAMGSAMLEGPSAAGSGMGAAGSSSLPFMPIDRPPGMPVDGSAVDAAWQAIEALNLELCACLGQDYDTCTNTTAESRACELDAFRKTDASATPWFQCVASYFNDQLSCIEAAACGTGLQSCNIVASAGMGPDGLGGLEAQCGPQTREIFATVEHCSADVGLQCASGAMVDASARCNGISECPDGSDELGCSTDPMVPCPDGSGSFGPDQLCDGIDDCANGADELACPSDEPPFVCDGGREIDASWVCDGTADCTDATDEQGCADSRFACGDGNFIDGSWVCDGEPDCANGSDETPEACSGL